MRVLLIEKWALARAAFRALLLGAPEVGEVSEAETVDDVVAALRAEAPPDVFVVSGDGMGVVQLEQAILALMGMAPGARVVVMDNRPAEVRAARAFQAGAEAYLSARCAPADLYRAVEGDGSGGRILGSCLSARVVASVEHGDSTPREPVQTLTARQRQILRLVAKGKKTLEIAQVLHLSPKTVEAHRSELLRRLGVPNVAGLVHLAIREGIIDPD